MEPEIWSLDLNPFSLQLNPIITCADIDCSIDMQEKCWLCIIYTSYISQTDCAFNFTADPDSMEEFFTAIGISKMRAADYAI